MKIRFGTLFLPLCLLFVGCMTVYRYQASIPSQKLGGRVEVSAELDKENNFFSTVITNKTSDEIYLNLEESYTLINGEAVGLTRMSSIRSLDGSGKTSPILIPPSAKTSVEIANVKQTDGVHYDTWFPYMWKQNGLSNQEIKLFLAFQTSRGEKFKESVSTKLGNVTQQTY